MAEGDDHVRGLTLDGYTAIPRVGGLILSPDGGRLVMTVQQLAADGKRYGTSLWELATGGEGRPRRLTYSEKGEGGAAFLPDGSLVFASARPDPTVKDDEAEGRLWVLPAGGGEARPLASISGGVGGVTAARSAPVLAFSAPLFVDSDTLAADTEKAKRRKDAGSSAILFESYPIRYWDHELGPRSARLLKLDVAGGGEVEDVTGEVSQALHESSYDLTPDGSTVVTNWARDAGAGLIEFDLVAIGPDGRRTLASDGDYMAPTVSPDGAWVAVLREERAAYDRASDLGLWLVDLASGEHHDALSAHDLWPQEAAWSPDASRLYLAIAERGRVPVYELELASGELRRLTDEGCFSSLCPAPEGGLYALRSSLSEAPRPVRIDAGGKVAELPGPGPALTVAGRVEEVVAHAADGVEIRAWLTLPAGASAEHPAPLLLWIHGGPLSSWGAWQWRWNPHLMAERGYAVLQPDPALSIGYGHDFIQRAWGRWGEVVLADLEASLDEALRRPDLDATRTAAMGGSFGGYMANWIAGHSDRFRAIVSHAGLWDLEQFHGSTDSGPFWEREWGSPYQPDERYRQLSPRHSIASVRTPMLVIHGQRDYRVPISEALRLWTDLRRHEVPSRFLFFPDENHWILRPGNIPVWYQTVLAFLDEHVLEKEWTRPDLV
ncbi:MAG TPA: S9 family peptidase [Candidatus Dormibacteraeota bacterium]|jgi:dipeptidyl aminopeptidase/acylaminoacyl peptidase|nr:S9 family peptidase [Candidatus Dormibacteraeota bacterium]